MVDHHTDFWLRIHTLASDLELRNASEWPDVLDRLQTEFAKYPKPTRAELQRGLGILLDRLRELQSEMKD